jgi:hypothetical protein
MFGWLKRRLEIQHRKLAYQTFKAAIDPEMPFLCLTKGGTDFTHTFNNAETFAAKLIRDIAKGSKPTTEIIGAVFDANKDMRRIYNEFGRKDRGTFDQVYQPLEGWTEYFDRSSNEVHLIESQREIRAEIANEMTNS